MEERLDVAELLLPNNQSSNFVTSVLTFVIVRFKAVAAEIAGTRKARKRSDSIIVLIIVEEYKLLVLGPTKYVHAVTAGFINHEEFVILQRDVACKVEVKVILSGNVFSSD